MTDNEPSDLKDVANWCQANGFEFYSSGSHIGVVCEYGDKRLYFYGESQVYPAFFSWSPRPRIRGQSQKITLLPYPGNSIAKFIEKLNKSLVMASSCTDHLGRPYDKDKVWKLAQIDFLSET